MLKIVNLNKIYKSKKGPSHHALVDINLEFGNKGYVFILGKSGSGKSTLLNVIGGLDRFNDGDIIIKDKSSKSFNPSEWDSYRNTYLGFVFQDFNIIDSYSIEKNIQLALELQSHPKKGMREKIHKLLKQVELEGLHKRKPNEMSGGQKQRIAIARALIKNPEIILADEPTGALDSTTSIQVLNILRKLAETKLVIMVSHDQEFAYRYADRIITLVDGKVASDESNDGGNKFIGSETDHFRTSGEVTRVIKIPKGKTISLEQIEELNIFVEKDDLDVYLPISNGKKLDYETIVKINDFSRKQDKDIYIPFIKNVDKIQGTTDEYFRNRVNPAKSSLSSKIEKPFKLIRSKLPIKDSFKMAVGNIWRKKFKLVFSVILFLAAIAMFGFSRTITRFDFATATSNSYEAGEIDQVVLNKTVEVMLPWSNGPEKIVNVFEVSEVTEVLIKYPDINYSYMYNFGSRVLINYDTTDDYVEAENLVGILEISDISNLDYVGDIPVDFTEIMLSDFVVDVLKGTSETYQDYLEDEHYIDLQFGNYKVVGVVNTDYRDYLELNNLNVIQLKSEKALVQAFENSNNVLYSRVIVKEGFYVEYSKKILVTSGYMQFQVFNEHKENNDWPYENIGDSFAGFNVIEGTQYVALIDDKTTLNDNEVVLDASSLMGLLINLEMVATEESISYLDNWNLSVNEKLDMLIEDGLINFDIDVSIVSRVPWSQNEAWLDPVTYKVVGISEFSRFKEEVLDTSIYTQRLEFNNIEVLPKGLWEMYFIYGLIDYLNELIDDNTINILDYDDWALLEDNSQIWDYGNYLSSVLNENEISHNSDAFGYGYYQYLLNVISENSVIVDDFDVWVVTLGYDDFNAYNNYLLTEIESALVEDTFTRDEFQEEYFDNVGRYGDYLKKVMSLKRISTTSPYSNVWTSVVFSDDEYDRMTIYSGEKVHQLMVDLSLDSDYNASFFREGREIGFSHQTSAGMILGVFGDFIDDSEMIFTYVSLAAAVFSVLFLFMNISSSVMQKKKEIGTLRAIGARGRDVGAIFVIEGLLIGLITSTLAVIALIITSFQLNINLSDQMGLDLSLFNVSLIIFGEMIGLALLIVVIASYLPVKRVSIMKPIDAILDK